jgi:DNA-binding PadR family transcriptional regulator
VNRPSAREVFVLGRVSLRPTHGHEIMRTLRESHADLWVELSEKHVYYVLRRLDEDGLVTAIEERDGNLPARRVYSITEAGRVALAEMLNSDCTADTWAYSDFDVVLGMACLTDVLTDDEKTALLGRRRSALEQRLSEVAGDLTESSEPGSVKGFPKFMAAKIVGALDAELAWLDSIASEVATHGWQSMRPPFDETGVVRVGTTGI